MAHAIFMFTAEHWMWCSYGMVGGRSVNVIFISECSSGEEMEGRTSRSQDNALSSGGDENEADEGERMEFVGMSVLFIYTRGTRRENKDDVTIFF